MKIELLIATVRGRWPRLTERGSVAPSISMIISNQYELESEKLVPTAEIAAGESMRVVNFKETGVSKSRNRALSEAEGDICVLCDDDTELVPDFHEKVRSAFAAHPDVHILTFRIRTRDGRRYKKYLPFGFTHNPVSVLAVSEVEIAFRFDAVRRNGLRFDERFGLGARFPSGEGNIFLIDALRAGLKVRYVPEEIVVHDWDSSGKRFEAREMMYSKGALFRRMYGVWGGMVVSLIFVAIKLPRYSRYFSPVTALSLIRKGAADFESTRFREDNERRLG